MAQELEPGVHGESDLIEIATRLACEGYWQDIKQLQHVSKVFRYDEQLWDAMKDEPGCGTRKRTRLMYAACVGNLERVRFLLDRGARVNKGNSFGATPLLVASQNGQLEVVRELAKRGANLNAAMTYQGWTALMMACQNGHVKVACELLEHGAKEEAPFHWFSACDQAKRNDRALLRKLLDPWKPIALHRCLEIDCSSTLIEE